MHPVWEVSSCNTYCIAIDVIVVAINRTIVVVTLVVIVISVFLVVIVAGIVGITTSGTSLGVVGGNVTFLSTLVASASRVIILLGQHASHLFELFLTEASEFTGFWLLCCNPHFTADQLPV